MTPELAAWAQMPGLTELREYMKFLKKTKTKHTHTHTGVAEDSEPRGAGVGGLFCHRLTIAASLLLSSAVTLPHREVTG